MNNFFSGVGGCFGLAIGHMLFPPQYVSLGSGFFNMNPNKSLDFYLQDVCTCSEKSHLMSFDACTG